MAGNGSTQAAQNFFNAKWAAEDRGRHAQMDEEAQKRFDAAQSRQDQLDEQNRVDREQRNNFATQDQMMQTDAYDRAAQEANRGLKMRDDMEQAALDSRPMSTGYSQSDFAAEPDENGVQQRVRGGLVHRPTYLQKQQSIDPSNAGKYQNEMDMMREEGILETALLLQQGKQKEAEQKFNSTGTGRATFHKDKSGTWLATEDDGEVTPFDVKGTIEYANEKSRIKSGKERKAYSVGKDDTLYGDDGRVIGRGANVGKTGGLIAGGDGEGVGFGLKGAGKVKRLNGQVVDENDIRSDYAKMYGTVDSGGNFILNENAPAYYDWRDAQVTPEYRIKKQDEAKPAPAEAVSIQSLIKTGYSPEAAAKIMAHRSKLIGLPKISDGLGRGMIGE